MCHLCDYRLFVFSAPQRAAVAKVAPKVTPSSARRPGTGGDDERAELIQEVIFIFYFFLSTDAHWINTFKFPKLLQSLLVLEWFHDDDGAHNPKQNIQENIRDIFIHICWYMCVYFLPKERLFVVVVVLFLFNCHVRYSRLPLPQVNILKSTIQDMEKERDFYFGKLRNIELICQEKESEGDPTLQRIVDILYATDVSTEQNLTTRIDSQLWLCVYL